MSRILLSGIKIYRKQYTEEEFNSLSEDIKQLEFEERVADLQIFFGIDNTVKNVVPTYNDIVKIHSYVMEHFNYTSDMVIHKKADFWDTEVLRRILLCGALRDDCDGAGASMLQLAYYVFNILRSHLWAAACATETGEGHYVVWIKADDNITYQIENRIGIPKTILYMKNKGYNYWDYASMLKPRYWVSAKKRVSQLLYETPPNLASDIDVAEFTIDKAISIGKSKTLLKEWFTVVSGTTISVISIFKDNANELVGTLQANQHNLSQFIDAKEVGVLMVVLGIIGVYLRTVTNKDVNSKRDYDG